MTPPPLTPSALVDPPARTSALTSPPLTLPPDPPVTPPPLYYVMAQLSAVGGANIYQTLIDPKEWGHMAADPPFAPCWYCSTARPRPPPDPPPVTRPDPP